MKSRKMIIWKFKSTLKNRGTSKENLLNQDIISNIDEKINKYETLELQLSNDDSNSMNINELVLNVT